MQLHMQADGMTHKSLIIFITIILATSGFFIFNDISKSNGIVQPKFYVDDDYDNSTPGWNVDHFDTINEAINASSAGDRIIVYKGTYNERLVIDHKLNLFGEDRDTTIIDGSGTHDVIIINAQYVNVSHFTIRDSGSSSNNSCIAINQGNAIITDNKITSGNIGITINNADSNIIYDNIIYSNSGNGIYLNHSDSNSITYNSITNNYNGIFIYNSSSNSIENNSAIKSNSQNGIFLNETSNLNTIANNNISSNTKNGIFLNDHCNNNTMTSNDMYSNNNSGVRMENSSYNTIQSSRIKKNTNYGIMVAGSRNTIQSSHIVNNSEHGIFLFADDYNTIYNNIIRGNAKDGIHLYNSTNDTVYNNEIDSNSQYGAYLDYFTFNNLIYNNYFHDNTNNSIDKSNNRSRWNIQKTSGTNKVGGSYLCGNYWDDFDEASESATDSEGDGIADKKYHIYGPNYDYGPILDVTPPTVGTPSASPSTQTVGSYTYVSVTVTDAIEIKEVYLHIVYPDNSVANFSITSNKTGNTYYSNNKYLSIGTYTYHIAAKDPRNWATSGTRTFIIDRGMPPTITDNSPSIGSPSQRFALNATITDDSDTASQLTNLYVIWSHGTNTNNNYSLVNVYGNYFEPYPPIILTNSISSLTYTIHASDRWGNSKTTSLKTVTITDEIPPSITIKKHEYSSDGVVSKYTVGAAVADNHEVSQVQIEYWFGTETDDHKTATMDKKSSNYYEKVIQLDSSGTIVYCIITATDPTGNQKNSKNPFANTTGPYSGVNGVEVTFNASNSFDLDGSISSYSWDFGDGTTGSGAIVGHTYSTNGNYTVTVTVTDNDGRTNTSTTYATISQTTQIKTSEAILDKIYSDYGISLMQLFYGYDTDGDSKVDTFVDPNNILTAIHEGYINISGNTIFLLNATGGEVPEFMWNITTDEIIDITHIKPALEKQTKDKSNKIVTQEVTINKTGGWIFLEVPDPVLDETLKIESLSSVTKNNIEIKSDMLFRKNDKTYVLDDPETTYQFKYIYKTAPLSRSKIIFIPQSGSTIDKNNPTITIKFNVPVTIWDATFIPLDSEGYVITNGTTYTIVDYLETKDNINFSYTPPNNLDGERYQIFLRVDQIDGNKNIDIEDVWYNYVPYAPKKMELPVSLIWMIMGGIIAGSIVIFAILRKKNIGFESFIYIKNKKIIPFFKPVIFGPLSIDVNDEKVSKAEFYVNGKLKDILTKEPFVWKFDDPMFMKQKIETKVYDESGNSNSSGEMTFYIFNPPHIFK